MAQILEVKRQSHHESESASSVGARTLALRGHSDISDEGGTWAEKTVMSFDGGGIRGYSSLLILKRIMLKIRELEIQHEEYPVFASSFYPWMGDEWKTPTRVDGETDRVDNFLPCHYFDYFAGTSTGGLSSIMLGRLRMTVDEALDKYADFGNAIFGKPRWFHETSLLWYPRAKFSSRKTRLAFQKAIYDSLQQDRSGVTPHDVHNEHFKYREDRARTIVISYKINQDGDVSKDYLWRTYDNNPIPINPFDPGDIEEWCVSNPGFASNDPIWQVARATTAAPRYFESIKIRGEKFMDGGMIANNPSLLALQEIHGLHNTVPALFVSIGTGLKRPKPKTSKKVSKDKDFATRVVDPLRIDDVRRKQFFKKYREIFKSWKDTMVDCEGRMGTFGWVSLCKAIGLDNKYRLNVTGDLSTLSLDEWRPADTGKTTIDELTTMTNVYLEKPQVKEMIQAIAKQAVDIRRQRARTERWEEFALDVEYSCPLTACGVRKRFSTRADLRAHLEGNNAHTHLDELEAALDQGWIFKRGTPYPRGP